MFLQILVSCDVTFYFLLGKPKCKTLDWKKESSFVNNLEENKSKYKMSAK